MLRKEDNYFTDPSIEKIAFLHWKAGKGSRKVLLGSPLDEGACYSSLIFQMVIRSEIEILVSMG